MRKHANILLIFALVACGVLVSRIPESQAQSQSGAPGAVGQNSNITQVGGVSSNTDPCGSWGVAKQSAVINIVAATTTQLVSLAASQTVFVCGIEFTMVGSAETIQFETGTGATCSTPTVLTGALADGTVSDLNVAYGGGEMTIFSGSIAGPLCAVTTGATVSIQGVITYVQRVAGT